MRTVAVLGAGSWGTALAVHLGRVGHDVRLWARDRALVDEMARAPRERRVSAGRRRFPTASSVTARARPTRCADAELVVSAIPSHGCRARDPRRPRRSLAARRVIVSATKGLEAEHAAADVARSSRRSSGRAHPVVVLSGRASPSRWRAQLPTAVLAASSNAGATELVQAEFRGPYFRLYGSDDVVGVEIGGALKNIIAIAAGVVEGLGLGHNALAALITRGLAEITRLACAAGGRRETLAGLSGLGDLVLTCTGDLSRNRHVGVELARGRPLHDILAGMKMVAEGVRTTGAALALGARYGVELPIATQMAEVLDGPRRRAHGDRAR